MFQFLEGAWLNDLDSQLYITRGKETTSTQSQWSILKNLLLLQHPHIKQFLMLLTFTIFESSFQLLRLDEALNAMSGAPSMIQSHTPKMTSLYSLPFQTDLFPPLAARTTCPWPTLKSIMCNYPRSKHVSPISQTWESSSAWINSNKTNVLAHGRFAWAYTAASEKYVVTVPRRNDQASRTSRKSSRPRALLNIKVFVRRCRQGDWA